MQPMTSDLRATFEAMHEWFNNDENSSVIDKNYSLIPSPRSLPLVKLMFDKIIKFKWNDEYSEIPINLENKAWDQVRLVVSSLIHHLRLMSENADKYNIPAKLKGIACIKYNKKKFICIPYWKKSNGPECEIEPAKTLHRFERIVVVGKLWRTEFLAEFMLGALAMANELNIKLHDCRQRTRTYRTENDGKSDRDLIQLVRGESLDPDKDAILAPFEDEDVIKQFRRNLKEYTIVTTGYANGNIRQDDFLTGKLLAEQCISDESKTKSKRKTKKIIIFIKFSFNETSNSPIQRLAASRQLLEDSGLFKIEEIKIEGKYDPPNDSAAIEAARLIRERIDAGMIDERRIAAIFPKTEGLTGEMIRFSQTLSSRPRIYGERMLTSDLKYLNVPGCSLVAICGVLPYFYGKYAVRAAAFRRPGKTGWPDISPVLITKERSLAAGIMSTDRIVTYFRNIENQTSDDFWNVELIGREYASDYLNPY